MMDTMFLTEMTEIFFDEMDEQLQIMEQQILELERTGGSEEAIQSLFRAAHTLKGSSAAMGFEEMKRLTHEMEHVLDQVRNQQLQVTHRLTNVLFKGLDCLKELENEFAAGEGVQTVIEPIIIELQHFTEMPGPSPQDGKENTRGQQPPPVKNVMVSQGVRHALKLGTPILEIKVELAPDCQMKSVRVHIIQNQLNKFGDVLQTIPSPEELEEEATTIKNVQFLLAGNAESAKVKGAVQAIMDVADVNVSPFISEHEKDQPCREMIESGEQMPKKAVNQVKRKGKTIRVDVDRLEQLMNLVGELVIDQTRIEQVRDTLRHRYPADESVAELEQISDHVSRVVGDMQEHVMKVRMLPIEQLFNRFPRMVRDLAQSLHKEINLVIAGNKTGLDRTVIEEISDPLIHLVRNAIDHGIETPLEREQVGKPPRGKLLITAAQAENQVLITVEDDGAGIDYKRIKDSALQKGVITEQEHQGLTEQESINLIFKPGFSTTSSVSDVSGRGVGMDIVRNHLEKLGGVVNVTTRPGQGTQFQIRLPLTLAIIAGLVIKLHESTFILPMSAVVEIVRIPQSDIQLIKGDSVVIVHEEVLPVIWLHDYFQLPGKQQTDADLLMVILGNTERKVAMVVDELYGTQDIVVKSLGSHAGKIDCISGATIMGNGQVALILEVTGILRLGRSSEKGSNSMKVGMYL